MLPRQLVFGLHVHVAVRGADRALAVHNALRSYLPELAALAGNAPLHAGRDTGLASLRPKICDLLPRQGVPPAWGSWEERAEFERWGRRGGVFPGAGEPWYELRAHDEVGTIELRVPDSQTTVEDAAGVIAFAAGLIAWLAERHDAGEPLPVHDHGRIVENRWRAMRHGLGGSLLDLDSGEPQPTRARIVALIDAVAPGRGAPRRRRRARAHARARGAQRRGAPARAGRRARHARRRRVARRVPSCHEGQRRHSDFRRPSVSRNRRESGRLFRSDARQGAAPTARRLRPAVALVRRGRRRRRHDPARGGRRHARARGARPRGAGGRRRAPRRRRGRRLPLRGRRRGVRHRPGAARDRGRRVGADRGRPGPARARAQRVRGRRLRRAPDRRRGRRAAAGDRGRGVLRARHAGRRAARRAVDRHRRARPRARRRRALPGARGQRAHAQRLRLRGRRPARAGRAPRGPPVRPPAQARRACRR